MSYDRPEAAHLHYQIEYLHCLLKSNYYAEAVRALAAQRDRGKDKDHARAAESVGR